MTWSGHWADWLQPRMKRAVKARRRMDGLPPGGFPRWTFHGFRHTMATHLREDLAVSPDVVSLLLGHSVAGPAVSRIYNRADLLHERRAALDAWARWLEGLKPETPAAVIPFRRR